MGTGVAPRAGAWIETTVATTGGGLIEVAPRAGAWIETFIEDYGTARELSRPARARGLKRKILPSEAYCEVAPRAGAWIETSDDIPYGCKPPGRAPRGRVD